MTAVPKAIAPPPPAIPVPKPPARMRLPNVVRGRLVKPIRLVLYATDGLGKSTFASHAPSPIFIGAEDGTSELDVVRMPDIATWQDILDCVNELEQSEHDYKTVVLDTADWAEPLCWKAVCDARKWVDLDAPGYGKGPAAALEEWRVLLSKLERVRARGMNVIILAHSVIKTFKNPESSGDFDRYEMALNPKAGGLIRQWADCVLFGSYETFTHTDSNKRTRGIASGARILHTQRTAAFDAKNRYDLPDTIPLDWQEFADYVAAHRPADPKKLRERIDGMLAAVTDETLKARVTAALAKVGEDAAQLARIADRLSADVMIKEKSE